MFSLLGPVIVGVDQRFGRIVLADVDGRRTDERGGWEDSELVMINKSPSYSPFAIASLFGICIDTESLCDGPYGWLSLTTFAEFQSILTFSMNLHAISFW